MVLRDGIKVELMGLFGCGGERVQDACLVSELVNGGDFSQRESIVEERV